MRTKKLFIPVTLLYVLVLLLCVGFQLGKAKPESQGILSTDELNKKVMAGITGMRISEENAGVFFDTLLGIQLSGYHAVDTIPELLYELQSNRADAIWCPDVTANYLLHTKDGENLVRLTAPKDSAGGAKDGGRLEFAFALRSDHERLKAELDAVIGEMRADGTMEKLSVAYLEADEPLDFYETKKKLGGQTYYVGVTGTLPPFDRYDKNGVPCGFSAAFLAEIEKRTGCQFVMVKVTPEDAFWFLENGKVDALLGFGTSKDTSPHKKNYITTNGYYTMQEYAYLSIKQ